MALNDRQINILRVIEAGNITGEDIAQALGSSMQLLSYYLTTMADDGYIKVAKVYDNFTREFQIVRAYLTDQGKDALGAADANITPVSTSAATVPKTDNPAAPSNDRVSMVNPFQAGVDFTAIAHDLKGLTQILEHLPSNRRELVAVYLEDLTTEVNIAYRRKPERVRAYFFATLNAVIPLLKQIAIAPEFIRYAKSFAAQLKIPLSLGEL
jgi:DeoR family transcriptional regulator, catabolite repression regulator